MAVTKRRFKMDEQLLFDTIQRQAGTLEKANVEGVMNSIEAGASAVHIELLAEGDIALMYIQDDGKGFTSEQEVADFFEVFGKPHKDNEKVIWKQFRMGRGQMFAYGKNVWRTGTFRMTVDIKNWGLDYEFEDELPFVEGCSITIELYQNPIGRYPYNSIKGYKSAIRKQVRFVETPVYFNGEQINTKPSECKWDSTDDDAYYIFNVGSDLSVYNLGVFVQDMPASRAGMGGIIVSKTMLQVNFARNDIDSKCPIMNRINEVIKKNRIKKTRQRRRTLDPRLRQATLADLRDGEQEYCDIKTLGLIPTAQGKHISLDAMRKNGLQWCFAERGDRVADKLMERDQALCIDDNILAQMDYSEFDEAKCFFSWLTGNDNENGNIRDWKKWQKVENLYVDFSELGKGISDNYDVIPDKKQTVTQRRILKVLNSFDCWQGRIINLGSSERANAWTNGSSYITIDSVFLQNLYFGWGHDVNKLMILLAHEMAHDCDTRGTHIHGPEFYENMVRILSGRMSPTVYNATFYRKMESSKIEEKRQAETDKVKKAEAKLEKRLGVAASTKP